MPMANRDGRFNAYPTEVGVGYTEKGAIQMGVKFVLAEEQLKGEYVNIGDEYLEISGYYYFTKKDGSVNIFTIDALKAAFGWDGTDPFWFEDNAKSLGEKPVQLQLGYEEYNGKTRLKVQFTNPYGSTAGGIKKSDDDTRRAIRNAIGSQLRALSGGKPVNTPKPSGKPASAPKAPEATPATPSTPPVTSDDVWRAFSGQADSKWSDKELHAKWFKLLAAHGIDDASVATPAQLGNVMAALGDGIPF